MHTAMVKTQITFAMISIVDMFAQPNECYNYGINYEILLNTSTTFWFRLCNKYFLVVDVIPTTAAF